jgi:hypothetical protein
MFYNITSSTDKTVAVTFKGNYYSSYSNEYSGVITIPETVRYNGITYRVTEIGDWAFGYCSNLTLVNIPNSIKNIKSFAFCGCTGLKTVKVPHSVESLGVSVFGYCSNLTSIVIGSNVKSIGNSAFRECTSLEMIECCAEYLPELEDTPNLFEGTPCKKLYVALSSIEIYKTASPWNEFEEILPIVKTVTYLLDDKVYAVDSVPYLAKLTLREVPEKAGYAFSGWSEAPETMPAENITVYGSYISGISSVETNTKADIYTLDGMLYRRNADLKNLNLPQGIYIIDGKKYIKGR